ncbi:Macoilin [Sergentomyia squamirostris]
MKRRNADCKFKRPIKRNKITEGMFHGSNTFLYIKFLFLWAIVITADFMLEFRFEFLWPFWLLLRSVHDSFKYKGLAFSVLFVCIAITSDLICLFFIPVNWLFFAASTYVWVQYVWHTEKGICLPTIVLWMLFLYIEGAIRWRDSRHMPHLDLCRPFAAHCIGYPVVTLGFGFKSYVGFRIRQRKQREVAKENEFYMQLLQQALPPEEPAEEIIPLTDGMSVTVTTASNGGLKNLPPKALPNLTPTTTPSSNGHVVGVSASNGSISSGYSSSSSSRGKSSKCDLNHSSSKSSYHQQSTVTAASTSSSSSTSSNSSSASSVTSTSATAVASVTSVTVKDVTRSSSDSLSGGSSREREKEMCTPMHNNKTDHHHHGRSSHSCPDGSSGHSDGSPSSTKSSQSNKVQHNGGINYINSSEQHHDTPDVSAERGKNRRNRTKQKDTGSSSSSRDNHHHQQSNGGDSGAPSTPITNHSQTSQTLPQVCEACQRLEGDVKRMRSDLQHMKQVEHDLRQKVDSGATIKSCLQAKQKENDELEKKIQDLNNSRHVDRQNLQNAEKRLGEERRQRLGLESQLTNERKMRIKVEEKAAKL